MNMWISPTPLQATSKYCTTAEYPATLQGTWPFCRFLMHIKCISAHCNHLPIFRHPLPCRHTFAQWVEPTPMHLPMCKATLLGGGAVQEAAGHACVEELLSPEEVAAARVQQLHPRVGRVCLTPDHCGDTENTNQLQWFLGTLFSVLASLYAPHVDNQMHTCARYAPCFCIPSRHKTRWRSSTTFHSCKHHAHVTSPMWHVNIERPILMSCDIDTTGLQQVISNIMQKILKVLHLPMQKLFTFPQCLNNFQAVDKNSSWHATHTRSMAGCCSTALLLYTPSPPPPAAQSQVHRRRSLCHGSALGRFRRQHHAMASQGTHTLSLQDVTTAQLWTHHLMQFWPSMICHRDCGQNISWICRLSQTITKKKVLKTYIHLASIPFCSTFVLWNQYGLIEHQWESQWHVIQGQNFLLDALCVPSLDKWTWPRQIHWVTQQFQVENFLVNFRPIPRGWGAMGLVGPPCYTLPSGTSQSSWEMLNSPSSCTVKLLLPLLHGSKFGQVPLCSPEPHPHPLHSPNWQQIPWYPGGHVHDASLRVPPCGQPRLHHCCSLVAWQHQKSCSSAQWPGSWCWCVHSHILFLHLKCKGGKMVLIGKDLTQCIASPPQIWLSPRVPAQGSSSTLYTMWTVQTLFLACTFVTFNWLATLSKSSLFHEFLPKMECTTDQVHPPHKCMPMLVHINLVFNLVFLLFGMKCYRGSGVCYITDQ